MIPDLFEGEPREVQLAPGAMLLGGFARRFEGPLVTALQRVVELAPFRHMVTPGGHRMSLAMTNCGAAGWVSDRTGYRYDGRDPESGRPWPPMPEAFADVAAQAAARAADKGTSASLAPSAARSTYGKYASRAAFGRCLASVPFSTAREVCAGGGWLLGLGG